MFDPNKSPNNLNSLYSLDFTPEESKILVYPIPFDAMSSNKYGSSEAPKAILKASHEIDLFDLYYKEPWKHGIYMTQTDKEIEYYSDSIKSMVKELRYLNSVTKEKSNDGGYYTKSFNLSADINRKCMHIKHLVSIYVSDAFRENKIPCVLGGDHSVSLGAIEIASKLYPDLVVVQIDAHMDLREDYENLKYSHASVMHNVMEKTDVDLVQIGIRDFCPEEYNYYKSNLLKINSFFDRFEQWEKTPLQDPNNMGSLHYAIKSRPIWITCDIDGLEPSICPNTGTPVPGGLTYNQFCDIVYHIATVSDKIVGFDLVEVGNHEWDANVGARILYQLSGAATMKIEL